MCREGWVDALQSLARKHQWGGARRGPREVERDIGFEERIVITEELMIQEALVGQGLISGFF